ncbi:MAG: glycosyltransferase family 2 protein [Thermoanaerobaculum sp.]|nr:glycosyltransferase family 2 protein [Thermoanaerobaculum sp.]MDW7966861.1 glycosyltransferase family 2 protein [Thermoanaerobaculum sp.]
MHAPRLSLVIPAFNEEHRLPQSLAQLGEYLVKHPQLLPAEVVVVDDGSEDRTAQVVESWQPPPGVAVVLHVLPQNRGKGAAVRAGLALAAGELVLITDADLATPIEELEKLLPFAPGAVACGSRAVDRRLITRRQPWLRDRLGRLFNLLLRGLRLTHIGDTQCGFKLLPGTLARRVSSQLLFDGFIYDVELLARAQRAGFPVVEVPVRWAHVEDSRVRPLRHGLAMVRDALRLRWHLWWEGLRAGRRGGKPG